MLQKQDRVLIVDDEYSIRKVLNHKLTREGYQCEEADCAEQTLNKLCNYQADLVILDVKMPGKSGVELLPEIKANYPDTAVIMATAVTDTSIAIECMKQGADDYVCKPFILKDVSASVIKALDKRKSHLQLKEYQQKLEERVNQQINEIQKISVGAIEALVFALEAKDQYTAGHSRRVTEIAVAIGNEMGLSEDDIEDLRCASLLHDVGKIAVDQFVQNKQGKLTRDEYEHIMIHTHVGSGIVKPVVNDRVVEMISHHHDHYDGSGLNQVVIGENIHLGAKIIAVADAFDAMTSNRPYRSGMSIEKALDEIKRCTGTQFDPTVVTAFLTVVITGDISNIISNLHSQKDNRLFNKIES